MCANCSISILFILFSFVGKLTANNLVNNELQHPGFDYDLHLTDGRANVHLKVFSNQDAEEIYNVHSYDDKGYLNEIQELIMSEDGGLFQNIWCDQFKHEISGKSPFEVNARGNKVYVYTPAQDPKDKILNNLNITIEVSADNNQVLSYQMTNNKVFSPAFATKIHTYKHSAECFPLLHNRTALKEFSIEVKGKAFFKSFQESTKRVYSNFRPSK